MPQPTVTPGSQAQGTPKISTTKFLFGSLFSIAIVGGFLAYVFVFLPTTPQNQPTMLTVENGDSVRAIGIKAKKAGLVRSETVLYALLTKLYDPTQIYAGTYIFETPLSAVAVAEKLAHGDIVTQTTVFTIPEGSNRKFIAALGAELLEGFSETEFLELSKGYEGKLFPETYFIPPAFSPSALLALLSETHEKELTDLDFSKSSLSKDEVITLASIVEREANDEESMKYVAGILQNRLSIGMALQVDASMEYVLDKPLKELTPADLKIDTPYNTYLYTGLPPTPIGNPGIKAIEAVLTPTLSEYMYYITGNDGNFYYAKTYNEHLRNIERQLK
jgi:UPF0755 protein